MGDFMKKVLVAVEFNDECLDTLRVNLKERSWEGVGEVHFVHGVLEQVYNAEFYSFAYPLSRDFNAIKSSIIDSLTKLEQELLPKDQRVKVIKECLIDSRIKESMVDYAEKKKIDQMFIATRNLQGLKKLFSSSFAEYMVRHLACELIILRPK
jgi:nucleotide-binding universal stress UspA family protein